MKYTLFILSLLLVTSCTFIKQEPVLADVTITVVDVEKYSTVCGTFVYNNSVFRVNNGTSGYYYKRYNLQVGQHIKVPIMFSYYKIGLDTVVRFSSGVNLTEYEVK